MKKITYTLLTWVSIIGINDWAHAENYHFKSFQEHISTLDVIENHNSELGDVLIIVTEAEQEFKYSGTIKSEDGGMIQKKVIELYPYKGDNLTIVTRPQLCGRGSCDFDSTKKIDVSAKLKIGESTKFYYSYE